MAAKDKAYEEHKRILEMDRPKEFSSMTPSSGDVQAYVRDWCAKNGLKHDAETERLKKAKRAKRTAGPKGKRP